MAVEDLVICDGLVKIYKVANLEVFALQGLELVVHRGELLGIVGASGSGKSTLMNILGGLARPSAGRVWVDGKDLLKISDDELTTYRSTKVGFVWQQGARNLISYLSAVENVRLPITLSGTATLNSRKRAEMLLDSVGLAGRMHHRLIELSGGEQQRVAIAVALANNPSLLLADEPTGEVDTATASGIFNLFKDLNRQFGLTTIIVSHDQDIAHHVDRVLAISDGKTSTEITRQTSVQPIQNQAEGIEETPQQEVEAFEEVVLLDSAGRLQVPREYLEKVSINRRAFLELTDDGIIIRPPKTEQRENDLINETGEKIVVPEGRGLRSLWRRLRGEQPERRQS